MTTLMDNTIDELIRRVKAEEALSDFVFVSAYPPDSVPSPIDRYLVAVSNTEVQLYRRFVGDRVAPGLRGAAYACTLRLRVYAPMKTMTAALVRASSLLADAVERADTGRIVQNITLSDTFYDTTARTTYRDVGVLLCCVLSEEAAS